MNNSYSPPLLLSSVNQSNMAVWNFELWEISSSSPQRVSANWIYTALWIIIVYTLPRILGLVLLATCNSSNILPLSNDAFIRTQQFMKAKETCYLNVGRKGVGLESINRLMKTQADLSQIILFFFILRPSECVVCKEHASDWRTLILRYLG